MKKLQTVQSLLLTFFGVKCTCLANKPNIYPNKEYNSSLQLLDMGTDEHLLIDSKADILFDWRHTLTTFLPILLSLI